MPLHFLYGKQLKNKDDYIFDEIKACINQGKKVLYVVPEQYSFSADKAILEALSEKYSHMTEILNFQRMANIINRQYSAENTEFLDDEIKNLVLYRVLSQNKLSTLKKRGVSPDNVLIFKDIISECKHQLIDADKLNEIKALLGDNKFLYNKMNDLSIVMGEYNRITEDKYHDFEDNLVTLAKNINKHNLFNNYEIFIDNFSTFSAAEYLILKELLKNCQNAYITLISDDFFPAGIDNLFYPSKTTYNKLTEICERININYIETCIDYEGDEFYIKLFSNDEPDNPPGKVSLTASQNLRDEARAVSAQIKGLIAAHSASFSDISVYTGDLSLYSDVIEQEFSTSDIPFFMDKSVPLIENPICRLLLTPLNMINSNYSSDAILEYVKSLVFLYSNHLKICEFEEYITRFNISRERFSKQESWQKNLDFVKERGLLSGAVSIIYESFVLPAISAFEDTKSYLDSYKQFIKQLKIEEFLERFILKDEKRREYVTCYNTFLEAVKNIDTMLANEAFDKFDYYNILLQSLSVYKTGVLPNSIDMVSVSDVERSRDIVKKYVFILGMNEGITPPTSQNSGFLSDIEREYIEEISGVELPTTLFKNSNSTLSLYRIFTSFDKWLFLSRSETNSDDERLMPSFIWQRAAEIYPPAYFENECINLQELCIYAAMKSLSPYNESSSCDNELIEKLSVRAEMKPLFESIRAVQNDGYFDQNKRLDKKILDSKYNKKLNTSVSRLETYKRCGYSYFIQYILKVTRRENVSYDFMKTGTLVHNIIDRFSKQLIKDKIDWDGATDSYIDKTLPPLVNREVLRSFPETTIFNTRTKYLIKRLTRSTATAIKNIKEHFLSGEFSPVGYEIEVGDEGIPPLVIQLSDGSVMQIFGKIDRADKLKSANDNELYVRIIDYKSSSKEFEFAMIKEGIQIQLLTYLKAIIENGGKYLDFSGEILPGAAFYVAVDDSIVNFERKPAEDEVSGEIKKKFMLKGLILNDDTLIGAIDRELSTRTSYKSEICEVSTKKDGSFTFSNLLFLEQFKKLLSECEKTLKEIGTHISEGYIPIKPYRYGKKNACEYCDYKSVCLFDDKMHSYNNIKKLKKDEYFSQEK